MTVPPFNSAVPSASKAEVASTLMVPPLTYRSPLESKASVSPLPILTLIVPPLTTIDALSLTFGVALMPSSVAYTVICPSLTMILFASIPSTAVLISIVPPSI
ncbi:hypothetical protein D3C73_1479430 [compost metagenome]